MRLFAKQTLKILEFAAIIHHLKKQLIKMLREETGASLTECHHALMETGWVYPNAKERITRHE